MGCLFECRLKFAITGAGCIPWNYPIPVGINEADFETCTNIAFENATSNLALFQSAIESENSTKDCDCMPDCEEVTFKPQVRIVKISHVTSLKYPT